MSAEYAGVRLCQSTPEVRDWIEKHISLREFRQFDRPGVPAIFSGLTSFGQHEDNVPIRLNVMRWPTGASRWATYHFIATDEQLLDIKAACFGDANEDPPEAYTNLAQPLILHGAGEQITFYGMYLLPPRPLSATTLGAPGRNRLWLCTLVDKRYWWNLDTCGEMAVEDVDTWDKYFGVLRTKLGLTTDEWDCATVHADWLKPHISLQEVNSIPLGMLLDAVAWNVGRRVSCDYEQVSMGYRPVVRIREYDWSETRQNTNLTNTNFYRLAGGTFEDDRALSPLLPESITLTFEDNGQARKHVTVDVVDYTGYEDYQGIGTIAFHDRAEWEELTIGEREALIDRIVQAYLGFQSVATTDVTYNAIVKWLPEGLNDIEWHELLDDHKELVPDTTDAKLRQRCTTFGMARTRVTRGPLNLVPCDLWHAGTPITEENKIICPDLTEHPFTITRTSTGWTVTVE